MNVSQSSDICFEPDGAQQLRNHEQKGKIDRDPRFIITLPQLCRQPPNPLV